MKTKSPLPWFGSEASVGKDLGGFLDGVPHVTIPFCGGMGILPHLSARCVLANDLHCEAIHFYKILQNETNGPKLIAQCLQTLCHPAELQTANQIGLDPESSPAVSRAWSFWSRCWLGRKGVAGTSDVGKRPSIRRNANGGGNASRLVAAAEDLKAWAEMFRRVEFLCADFRDVLAKVTDASKCGVYVDPPWLQTGDEYVHEFSENDHYVLSMMLADLKHSPLLIRYGDCELVRKLYPPEDWNYQDARSRNQANKAVEEVWITRRC